MINEKKITEFRQKIASGVPLIGNEPWPEVIEMLDTIDALWKVVRSAEKMIYAPRTEYKPGSKKAALRDALEGLKAN